MWKAIGDDDQSTYDGQQLLTQLRIENSGIRELLFIACNSGNPLKAVNQHTQTDAVVCLPRHGDRASGLSLLSESNKGDTESEFWGLSDGATPRNSRPDYSLSSAVLGRGNDTCLAPAVQSPREFRSTKASSDLPCDSFASPQNRGTRAASEIDGPSFSSARPALSSSPTPVHGGERVESALDDVVLADVATSPNRSIEQMRTEDERTFDSKLLQSPIDHATVVNHACDNPTPNCLDEPNHSQIYGNLPSDSADAFSATSNCSSANAERTSQVSSSSAVNTATTAAAVSAPPPKQHVTGKTQVNETPTHLKGTTGNKNIAAAATSSGNRGSPKAASSPSHGATQKNVSTPSTGGTPSRLKYGGAASTIPHSKTPPGKVSAVNKTASAATGGKNSPSTSPSIHSGKTATGGNAVKATPIRIIQTTPKQSSLFSAVLGVASAASLHSNATTSSPAIASAVLDSNGNNSQSPVPSENISNANKRSPDVSVDGQ